MPEPVIVLSYETNQKVFGGENSVGRSVRVENQQFQVVGVLKPWRPLPKFYDTHNGAFDEVEDIYLPFGFFRPMKLHSAGNTSNWKDFDWDDFDAYLASEAIWIQYWVQLDSPSQKEEYQSFLDAYVGEQKKLGRMERPMNNKLLNVKAWLDEEHVVPEDSIRLMAISVLFLMVCALNLIGILLGKFLSRSPEISVRRALGASRRAIFVQYVIECETIGFLGGIVGVGLSLLGVEAVNRLFTISFQFRIDQNMIAIAILLSLVAGLVAGLYPAWRVCSIPPAVYLKER